MFCVALGRQDPLSHRRVPLSVSPLPLTSSYTSPAKISFSSSGSSTISLSLSLSLSLSCSPRGQTREVSALGRPPFNLCCSRNPRRPPSPVDLQAPRCVCIGHLCRPCCPPRSRPSLSSPRSRLVSETGRRASFREKLKIGHASAQLGLRGGGGIASAAARRTWVDGSRRGVGRGRCDRDRR